MNSGSDWAGTFVRVGFAFLVLVMLLTVGYLASDWFGEAPATPAPAVVSA